MRRINRQKASTQVADVLRDKVLNGTLAEGERLPPERELVEGFGVSRATVREAIQCLVWGGLLEVKQGTGGGTFVRTSFHKPLETCIENLMQGGSLTLQHLFEMRLLLETPAAATAARRAQTLGTAALEEALSAGERVQGDPLALRAANLEFHRRIADLAGNPLQAALVDVLIRLLTEALEGTPSLANSRRVFASHRDIYAAIRTGDEAAAARCMTEDLERLQVSYESLGVTLRPRP